MASYVRVPLNSQAVLAMDFENAAGALADPTEVKLYVVDPEGVRSTYVYTSDQLTRASTGKYNKSFVVNKGGYWHWRWEGTGAVEAEDEGRFYVPLAV